MHQVTRITAASPLTASYPVAAPPTAPLPHIPAPLARQSAPMVLPPTPQKVALTTRYHAFDRAVAGALRAMHLASTPQSRQAAIDRAVHAAGHLLPPPSEGPVDLHLAAPCLLGEVRSRHARTRRAAAEIAARLAESHGLRQETLLALYPWASHSDTATRTWMGRLLAAQAGSVARVLRPAPAPNASMPPADLRASSRKIAASLVQLGASDRLAMLHHVDDHLPHLQGLILEELGHLAATHNELRFFLRSLIDWPELHATESLARALIRLDDLPGLLSLGRRCNDAAIVFACLVELPPTQGLERLRQLQRHWPPEIGLPLDSVAEVLTYFGDYSAVPPLIELANRGSRSAIAGLGEIGDQVAVNALDRLLVQPELRPDIVAAMNALGDPRGIARARQP